MKYISTRGQAPKLDFEEVLLTGLAEDGGLYLPETWPQITEEKMKAWAKLSYADLAAEVMEPFVSECIDKKTLTELCHKAYGRFRHEAVTPLKQLDSQVWLQELFQGPTLAFKDCALQMLGLFFEHTLAKKKSSITIIGATSGDTGSAAIEACRDREGIEIFILFPDGKVSDVQRRQMTTVDSPNVHCVAVDGTFDDCQDLVKACFNDHEFRNKISLSAVNSINWARIMAQIVYYFYSALRLGAPEREVQFAVPTGNFGNVFAGYAAQKMGLPISKFLVGSNRNDILTRFFNANDMSIKTVEPSLSPSMDIQISSNFERFLYFCLDENPKALTDAMTAFRKDGKLPLSNAAFTKATECFEGFSLDDEGILAEIARVYTENQELIDPHTAASTAHAKVSGNKQNLTTIVLATAHPAKFSEAVKMASGVTPKLPPHLSHIFSIPENYKLSPNDLSMLQTFVMSEGAATYS